MHFVSYFKSYFTFLLFHKATFINWLNYEIIFHHYGRSYCIIVHPYAAFMITRLYSCEPTRSNRSDNILTVDGNAHSKHKTDKDIKNTCKLRKPTVKLFGACHRQTIHSV